LNAHEPPELLTICQKTELNDRIHILLKEYAMPVALDNILEQIQTLHYEISTESRLVRVGLKDEQNLEAIINRYPLLTNRETAYGLKQAADAAKTPDEKERLARLYLYCLGHYIHKSLAAQQDQVTTFFSQAVYRWNGEDIPYYELYPRLMKENDFDRREQLGRGFVEIHEKANPLHRDILKKDLDILKNEFGYAGYIGFCRDKKKLDYASLAALLTDSLERTRPVYEKAMAAFVLERLNRPFGKLWRVHIPHLLQMKDFDSFFPKENLLPRLNASLKKMGIDFKNYPNIHLDLEERPKKNPRACCFTSKVPDEIHLILKPTGGLKDYETFLHEGGHALHYGNSDRELPYEYRELSRSYALTETYAFLMQNLTMSTAWLEAEGVPAEVRRKIRRERVLIDLFMYRRYVGKFLAEHAFFKKGDLEDSSFYSETLQKATGFVYEPSGYLADMDSEFYSMDYLRAWIAEAQLEYHMKKTFGECWFAFPEAGKFLIDLWKRGEIEDPETMLGRFDYKPFDVTYLEKRFEELK